MPRSSAVAPVIRIVGQSTFSRIFWRQPIRSLLWILLLIILVISLKLATAKTHSSRLMTAIALIQISSIDPLGSQCTFPHFACLCARPTPDVGFLHCGSQLKLTRLSSSFFKTISGQMRMHILHFSGNDIQEISAASFVGTGLHQLHLTNNRLNRLSPELFEGLQRSLRILSLANNELTEPPVQAMRQLRRLNLLDLSNNRISQLQQLPASLNQTLHTLNLAGNELSYVDAYVFASLLALRFLDLSNNRLLYVHENAFARPTQLNSQLQRLSMAGNRIFQFPCKLVGKLKSLQILSLEHNQISSLPEYTCVRERIRLNTLNLAHNQIKDLHNNSFQAIQSLDLLILSNNDLGSLPNNLFHSTAVMSLEAKDAQINLMYSNCFVGIHRHLRRLDLSWNPLRLEASSTNIFSSFPTSKPSSAVISSIRLPLQSLPTSPSISSNQDPLLPLEQLTHFRLLQPSGSYQPNVLSFSQSAYTLETLQLDSTNANVGKIEQQTVPAELEFNSLRTLRLPLRDEDASRGWPQFRTLSIGGQLDSLDLSGQSLQKLTNSHLLQPMRSLTHLDLSDNSITTIISSLFRPIGRTLRTLKLDNALHSMNMFDCALLAPLQRLQVLTMAGNQLERFNTPSNCFAGLSQLKFLDLQWNHLDSLCIHSLSSMSSLQHFQAAHNRAVRLRSYCFSHLPQLQFVDLSFNQLRKIDANAFYELPLLRLLDLSFNKLQQVADSAFTLLPNLQELRLQNNQITQLQLSCLDLVGGIGGQLTLNLDGNHINTLFQTTGLPDEDLMDDKKTRIVVTTNREDESIKNSDYLQTIYSETIDSQSVSSLSKLVLSRNRLSTLPLSTLIELRLYLQTVDFSFNHLTILPTNSFSNFAMLQNLLLNANQLSQLPGMMFNGTFRLQQLNLSSNLLHNLPQILFDRRCLLLTLDVSKNRLKKLPSRLLANCHSLQNLHLSHNLLNEFPSNVFQDYSTSQLTLLDLSHNRIEQLPSITVDQLNAFPFVHSLITLDLSFNHLQQLTIEFFGHFRSLRQLDLSGNKLNTFQTDALTALQHLQRLRLSSCELKTLPPLPMRELQSLDISHNQLNQLHGGVFMHLAELRSLDCSFNRLTHIPSALLALSNSLDNLKFGGNPIQALFNESFAGLSFLRTLHLIPLPSLGKLDSGAFRPLQSLRELHIGARLPRSLCELLQPLDSLRRLELWFNSIDSIDSLSSETMTDTVFCNSHSNTQWLNLLQELWLSGDGVEQMQWEHLPILRSRRILLRIQSTHQLQLNDALLSKLAQLRQVELQLQDCSIVTNIESPTLRKRLTELSNNRLVRVQLNRVQLACDCSSGWIQRFLSRKRIQYSRQMADWISNHRNEWQSWTDSKEPNDVNALFSTNHSLTYWQVMHVHLEQLHQLHDDLNSGFCAGHPWLSFSTPISSGWTAEVEKSEKDLKNEEILVLKAVNRDSHYTSTLLSALRNEMQNCRNCATCKNKMLLLTIFHFLFVWCYQAFVRIQITFVHSVVYFS